MATMTTAQRRAASGVMMERLSAEQIEVPGVLKQDFIDMIGTADVALEVAETTIVTTTPLGPMRTFLVNNPNIGRRILEAVEEARRKVL